ncbi:MAG: FKBP-type peptidyl-prolyl cis-trans isomerase [Candidatus Pacebacteria bacterium]|nr:FKBP-type peptidyl-prolyl cis-trans isomerase [Candidatus Paceibacterota bacterium]
MNITGTGIAVALAVVVALGLLFFGPQVLTFFNHPITNAAASNTSMQNNEPTSNEASSTGADLSNIPQNPTQLMVSDQTVGTGAVAQAGDQVTVSYVGMLTDGTVFDASANHGGSFTFALGAGQVIKGWDEGVAGMKVGGKRELVIPASLGYGAQAVGPIPANSTLVFEVQLLDVQPAKQ